jgi:WD40 repeat protein
MNFKHQCYFFACFVCLDIITCVSLDHVGRHLITGSRDTTCMVWEISQSSGFCQNIDTSTVITLYGHDQEVTDVHMSIELDLAVSASKVCYKTNK